MLVVGGSTGWLGPDDFPDPVGTALILVFDCALLPVGALLWRLSNGPVSPHLLRTLAIANLTTAAALLVWRIAATGFSTAGTAITLATLACLAFLGLVQSGTARGLGSSRPESLIYKS